MVIVAFIMLRSPDQHTHEIGRYLGYGAVVVLLIARFAFRRPAPPTPPMPRE